MITASDGSVFTGSVTVYVTGDAGTQAAGSVGSGACTHEGNGYHTYAPAQAETNYDLIAFTFVGTGAVAATVQVYPSFPQTVDLSTGITAGTITTVSGNVNGSVGSVTGAVGSVTGAVGSVTGLTASDVAAIKAKTDNLPAAPAAVGDIPTATQNADALLNRDMSAVSDTNARSPLNALRFLRNKWSVAAGTLTVTKENDSTSAWTAAISTDAAAVPVIGSDPA